MPDRLLTSPWFHDLPYSLALERRLRPVSAERHYPPGATIFEQGSVTGGLYYVLSGRVRQSVLSRTGTERLIAIMDRGSLLGEVSALDGQPSQLTAVALTKTVVLFVEREHVAELLRRDGELAAWLVRSLLQKLRTSTKLIADQSLRTVSDRLSCLLHQFARQQGPDHPQSGRVTLRVSHQQLADLLGVSRVTVSQGISSLKEAGLVETGHGEVYVLNPPGLRSCGDGPYCISHGRPVPDCREQAGRRGEQN